MRQIILIMTLLAVMLGVEARTVRDFFASEPGELLTLVPKTVRLDMLDYYDSGTIVQASNNMGNATRLDTVTDNFLRLHTSDVKTLEMRLMKWKNDTIIAVVETVETPVKDSRITFFNKHWVQLKEIKPFKMPTMEDFILPTVKKNQRKELLENIAFPLIELSFGGPNFEQLTARHGLAEFLGKEEWAKLKPYFRPTLTYSIQGGNIKRTR